MNQPVAQDLAEQTALTLPTQAELRKQCGIWLKDYCDTAVDAAKLIDKSYVRLWEAISTSVLGGGKRLRPYLFLLSYRSFNGEMSMEKLMPVTIAHELLHQCLLVHDDVIDRDYIRHGQPNVAGQMLDRYGKLGKSDAKHYANSLAILAGDLLLSDVYHLISHSIADIHLAKQLSYNFNRAISQVAAGELMDVDVVIHGLHDTDVYKVANYKTASYSFVLPLVNGALLASASEREHEMMEKLGTSIGIAYQLQDDLLGLFGDESVTGKSTLSDLREGKHTLMLQLAEQKADLSMRKIIINNIGNKSVTEADAEAVRNVVRLTGAYDEVCLAIDQQIDEATKIISQLSLANDANQAFTKIIKKLVKRKA